MLLTLLYIYTLATLEDDNIISYSAEITQLIVILSLYIATACVAGYFA